MSVINRVNVPGSTYDLQLNAGIQLLPINNSILIIGHIKATTTPVDPATGAIAPYSIVKVPKYSSVKSTMDWLKDRGFDMGLTGATSAQQSAFVGSGGLIPASADEIVKGVYHAVANTQTLSPFNTPNIYIAYLASGDINHGTVFTNAVKYYFRAIVTPYEMNDPTDMGLVGNYGDFYTYIESQNGISSSKSGRMLTFGVYGNISTTVAAANVAGGGLPNTFVADKINYLAFYYPYDNAVEGVTKGNKPYVYTHTALDVACAGLARILSQASPYEGLRGVTLPSLMLPSDPYQLPDLLDGGEADTIMNQGWIPICYKENVGLAQLINTPIAAIYYPGTTAPLDKYENVTDYLRTLWLLENLYNNLDPLCGVKLLTNKLVTDIQQSYIPQIMIAGQNLNMLIGVEAALKDVTVEIDPVTSAQLDVYIPVSVTPVLKRIASVVSITDKYFKFSFGKKS